MSIQFMHELAARLTQEQSSAVNFIGVFDKGRRLTIQGHGSNKAYVYDVSSDPITPVTFSEMLKRSLGKEWGKIRTKFEVIETIENISGYDVLSQKWYSITEEHYSAPVVEWLISGESLYDF